MKHNKPARYYDPDELRARLGELDPVKIADELARLEPSRQAEMFRQIEGDRAREVFCLLDAAHQETILGSLDETRAAALVEELDPDDRARLFTELAKDHAEKLLAGLSPQERRLTIQLLDYPAESAGRIMTPEYVSLQPDLTAAEALQQIREQAAAAETIHTLPVIDSDERLVGMLELSDLVLAAPETPIRSIIREELRSVRADTDQETVARLLQAADLLAVPVVDAGERLLGLVTVDDAMDVLTREEEEDISRAGGTEPLRRPYFSVSDLRLARSRIVWLLVLIVAATLTVQVLKTFEQTLDQVVALAMFIPLLIGTGGNAGAQSATTLVRGMAVGDVHPRDFLRTLLREARVGLLLGLMLGLLSYGPVWIFADPALALVVSLTLVSICTLASAVGALMPLLARSLGVDPAVASAPFVTTVVDATGLLVYFLIARAVLQL
ncbi:MAG TPA: magnesium transporter [Desulfuromonadales bacterium]|nr:magnesium transporter [Desulfuromonadales bacterium]